MATTTVAGLAVATLYVIFGTTELAAAKAAMATCLKDMKAIPIGMNHHPHICVNICRFFTHLGIVRKEMAAIFIAESACADGAWHQRNSAHKVDHQENTANNYNNKHTHMHSREQRQPTR